MASKVLFQSAVHKLSDKAVTSPVEPIKKQYERAAKQLVDTFAPGANPRRTKNRQVD